MKKVPVKIVLVCIECGEVQFFEYRSTIDEFREELWRNSGYYLSVINKPGEGEIVFAPLCQACAPKVHPKAVLDAAQASMGPPGKLKS